ncbi:MAG TPA: ABC transporter permease [Spirochaetota bacterium]|nr:ABC transporter permease [Spirochaetota bacterium]
MMADGQNNGTQGGALPITIGEAVLRFWDGIRDFGAYVYSIFQSFKSLQFIRMRAVYAIILQQTKYTGIDAFPFIIVIAILLGGVVIIQGMTNLPKFGIEGYFGNLLVIIIARELGPLVTALIVISRSGSAMATETATQQWSKEILALEISGIDPRLFIVIPRIAATILSIFSLIIFFDIVAFLGGYFISLTTIYIPLDMFFQNLGTAFSLKDLAATILKSLVFGLLIPLVSCYYGMMPRSKFEIPIFVSRAVSRTLFFTVLLNVAISVAFYFTWLE